LKALVLHTSLSGLGGAEKVSLTIIELLKSMGFKVRLFTMEPTNWFSIVNIFRADKEMLPDEYMSLLKFRIRKFTIYTRLIMSKIMELKSRKGYDLTINSHGDALPIASDIIYMHFPGFVAEEFSVSNKKYFEVFHWRIYFGGYLLLRKYLMPSFNNSVILTNSNYSKAVIKYKLGLDSIVIYPPIDTKIYTKAYLDKTGNEPYIVLSIGRFSPEKNYEFIIDIASRLKDVYFYIIGSIGSYKNLEYYNWIAKLIERKNVKNVYLKPNVPLEKLLEYMINARVILHAMKHEHFGMVVAEGMVAGLIPVVHRSGGVYYDVIECGRYGYAYNGLEDAIDRVEKALEDYSYKYKIVHEYAVRKFGKESFINNMRRVIEDYLSSKRTS
jgi:alpha-1,2-mannosyltransferase